MARPHQPAAQPRPGWKDPAAIALFVLGLLWIVGCLIATTDLSIPVIEDVPLFTDLGRWNYLIGAVILFIAASRYSAATVPDPDAQSTGWRWAAPAMIGSAGIGLLWIVVFYVTNGTDIDIPGFTDLGNWNLVIGMGFIVAAFGFAMKWE